ncbi:hypothetical protein B0H13DRAFT_1612148 [Mycena leptocephala]|nr:hypothetical protein B0H13DRAFT_1612148 [Mycena leptocephala]
MPTYRRTLSPNELYALPPRTPFPHLTFSSSYFLPSRAYGLNDMISGITIHAPPALISSLRVRIVWAIMRLRHSLMACRVEMAPGCYDDAQFVYTPPSSPSEALTEATSYVRMFGDITGPDLLHTFLNGPRILSSDCLSRLDVARHDEVSPGIHEFYFVFMLHHMINDSRGMHQTIQSIFELLGGPATPGGSPRTDAELAKILDHEWRQRWDAHAHGGIVPATEVRILGLARSKFHEAAWKVDNQSIQRRFIGGQVFPRTKSPVKDVRLIQAQFNESQTLAISSKCKAKRVTVGNVTFGLINLAWIRLCAAHPEIDAPKDLPMLMYTAISLRHYLRPASPLESYMSLALDYFNVVLPTFLPENTDSHKMFWARCRAAQCQVSKYAQSPLHMQRAIVTNAVRGERAKVWARIDDEADGTLPPTPRAPAPAPAPGPKPPPSIALIGVSQSGDGAAIYRTEAYPSIKLVDSAGGTRKASNGLIFYTGTFLGKFCMVLLWDAAPIAPGLMEEFWRYVVDGMHEYVLEDPSLKGTAKETDCLANEPVSAKK